MPFPKITGVISSSNLLRFISADDNGALAVTVSTSSLIGEVNTVYNLKDAESKGYTEESEPFAHRHIKEFYTELGGNQPLVVFGMPETMTLTQAVDFTNENGLKKLLSKKDISIIAMVRKPPVGYNGGTAFFDSDVESAVLGSLALCQNMQVQNRPFRLLMGGRVANENADNTFIAHKCNNGYVGVVLGGTQPDGSASVALALARACKYHAHVKLGSGQNGALSATEIYIGSKPANEIADYLEVLHDTGLITFYNRPGAAGYWFGLDNMCSDDDFRILAHGRIIDKAQRIMVAALTPYIEETIRIEKNGTLNTTDTAHLEDIVEASLRTNMSGQVSDLDIVIDPNQDIINTSTLRVQGRILPLGYMTWIEFTLGLAASLTEN